MRPIEVAISDVDDLALPPDDLPASILQFVTLVTGPGVVVSRGAATFEQNMRDVVASKSTVLANGRHGAFSIWKTDKSCRRGYMKNISSESNYVVYTAHLYIYHVDIYRGAAFHSIWVIE